MRATIFTSVSHGQNSKVSTPHNKHSPRRHSLRCHSSNKPLGQTTSSESLMMLRYNLLEA